MTNPSVASRMVSMHAWPRFTSAATASSCVRSPCRHGSRGDRVSAFWQRTFDVCGCLSEVSARSPFQRLRRPCAQRLPPGVHGARAGRALDYRALGLCVRIADAGIVGARRRKELHSSAIGGRRRHGADDAAQRVILHCTYRPMGCGSPLSQACFSTLASHRAILR